MRDETGIVDRETDMTKQLAYGALISTSTAR